MWLDTGRGGVVRSFRDLITRQIVFKGRGSLTVLHPGCLGDGARSNGCTRPARPRRGSKVA